MEAIRILHLFTDDAKRIASNYVGNAAECDDVNNQVNHVSVFLSYLRWLMMMDDDDDDDDDDEDDEPRKIA